MALRTDKKPEDAFNLSRFVHAQQPVYAQVLQELREGRKRSHWMWFIFPQLAGLGASETARFYAISSLLEAQAYLAHPLLGPRLRECTSAVLATDGKPLSTIFGYPDDLKFCSSMTLFAEASGPSPAADNAIFSNALAKYGATDIRTLTLLRSLL
jgi:uncharacterized protein (DUF1810 family)